MALQLVEPQTDVHRLLWPKLSRTNGSASRVLLAVLVKGIANGVPTDVIRQWAKRAIEVSPPDQIACLRRQQGFDAQSGTSSDSAAVTRGTPTLMDLLTWSQPWGRFCIEAERKVLSSPSLPGVDAVDQVKLLTARRKMAKTLLAGLLLSPENEDARSFTEKLAVRVTLASFGVMLLEDHRTMAYFFPDAPAANRKGWDTAGFTQPQLVVMTGWSLRTAFKYLHILVEDQTLTRLSAPGDYGRFRMRKAGAKQLAQTRRFHHVAESIADDTPDPLADVMRSISHPAWAYTGALSHKHWLVLLADLAGVPASRYGMRPEVEETVRGEVEHLGLMESAQDLCIFDKLDSIAAAPQSGIGDNESGDNDSALDVAERAYSLWRIGAEEEQRRRSAQKTSSEVNRAEELDRRKVERAARKTEPVKAKRRSDRDEVVEQTATLAPAADPEHEMLQVLSKRPVPKSAELLDWLARMRNMVITHMDDRLVNSSRPILHFAIDQVGYGAATTDALVEHILDGTDLPVALIKQLQAAIELEPVF